MKRVKDSNFAIVILFRCVATRRNENVCDKLGTAVNAPLILLAKTRRVKNFTRDARIHISSNGIAWFIVGLPNRIYPANFLSNSPDNIPG